MVGQIVGWCSAARLAAVGPFRLSAHGVLLLKALGFDPLAPAKPAQATLVPAFRVDAFERGCYCPISLVREPSYC
jgi:hypothetical protein